jgi:hypothetical protein
MCSCKLRGRSELGRSNYWIEKELVTASEPRIAVTRRLFALKALLNICMRLQQKTTAANRSRQ